MSRTTEEINKVTGTVIGLSLRLISCAVVLLLLAEGVSRGYHFGYEVFSSSAVDEAPGKDRTVTITGSESDLEICQSLEEEGLITDGLAAFFQMKFYEYEIYPGTYELNTSMTAKEILQMLNQKPEEDAETTQDAVQQNADAETAEDTVQDLAEEMTPEEAGDVSVEVIEEEGNGPETGENMTEAESEIKQEPETEAGVEPEPEIEIQIN